MYTQCPSCNVIFAMFEEDLDAHQGLVRCGRCGEVFNASWNLVDSVPEQHSTDLKSATAQGEATISTVEITGAELDEFILDDAALTAEAPSDESELEPGLAGAQSLRTDFADTLLNPDKADEGGEGAPDSGGPPSLDWLDVQDTADTYPSDEQSDFAAPGSAEAEAPVSQVSEEDEARIENVQDDQGGSPPAAGRIEPDAVALGADEQNTDLPPGDAGAASRITVIDQSHTADFAEQPGGGGSADASASDDVYAQADEATAGEESAQSSIADFTSIESGEGEDSDSGLVPAEAAGDIHSDVTPKVKTEINSAEVSAEEEIAIDELNALLSSDTAPDESLLIPEEAATGVADATLVHKSTEDELASSTLETTLHEAEAETADTEVMDLVDDQGLTATDAPVASKQSGRPNKEEVSGDETRPQAESAEHPDPDALAAAGNKSAHDQPGKVAPSMSPDFEFPDVEPEEIVIEAPTRLWGMGDDIVDDGLAPSAETAGRTAQRARLGRFRLPYAAGLALWSLGSILLMFGLVWQIKGHYLVDLAQFPTLRDPLKQVCEYLQCSVPPRADIKAIDLVGTSVDPHPVAPGALRVSASLINRASFAQQFPPLEITLTDKAGEVVGRRTYLPHEYRDDAPDRMLPNVLEKADFDLAQPAESAVGYEIQLVVR